jgi:arylsulfatase A-like enzyme
MTAQHFNLRGIAGLILLFLVPLPIFSQDQPNVLVIVADDLGIDALQMYDLGTQQPNTPNLDALAQNGLRFTNAWSTPICAPTRATVLTGLHGTKTGVLTVPGELATTYTTLFETLDTISGGPIADSTIGKWHIGRVNDENNPNDQGVDHYVGPVNGLIGDQEYSDWIRTENGVTSPSTEYLTSHLVDEAIEWIDEQTGPWFLWHSHFAPHAPFHLPPEDLFTRTQTNGNLNRYLCMIEALDHEIGRLLDSMTTEERDRTLVIFFGDNGTPNQVLQGYPDNRGKGSLFQGGINVPFIVSGHGVTRTNETEEALVQVVDVFATVLEAMGEDLPGGINNSRSFLPLLSDENAPTRDYNFVDYETEDGRPYAIRNDRYKLIVREDETRELYDLLADPFELTDLVQTGLTPEQQSIIEEMAAEAQVRLEGWSCNDGIQNGDETGIDIGGTNCPNLNFNGTLWALQ